MKNQATQRFHEQLRWLKNIPAADHSDAEAADLAHARADAWARSPAGTPYGSTTAAVPREGSDGH